MAVNAKGAVAAVPDRLGLDRRAGSAVPIQLLTPEGERVEHPDYPLAVSAGEVQALYRDLVLVRRIDFEAIALQRQCELGIWASLRNSGFVVLSPTTCWMSDAVTSADSSSVRRSRDAVLADLLDRWRSGFLVAAELPRQGAIP